MLLSHHYPPFSARLLPLRSNFSYQMADDRWLSMTPFCCPLLLGLSSEPYTLFDIYLDSLPQNFMLRF